MTATTGRSTRREPELARPDRRPDRRQRGHRARDGPAERAPRAPTSSSRAAIPNDSKQAALDVGARSTAAFDATDTAALERFFDGLPGPIDHVMVTAGGPTYGPLLEMTSDQVRDALSDHVVLGLEVARNAPGKMRPGGTLLLMGGTGGRRIVRGSASPPRPPPRPLRSWRRSRSSSRRSAST